MVDKLVETKVTLPFTALLTILGLLLGGITTWNLTQDRELSKVSDRVSQVEIMCRQFDEMKVTINDIRKEQLLFYKRLDPAWQPKSHFD